MKIEISPELRTLMDSQLEHIKKKFIEAQFAFNPMEAERFSITEIEEQCLVYPNGTFKIEGEYTYGGKIFWLHTYLRGDETLVTLIDGPESTNFSSMEKAVVYCKNSIGFQPTWIGDKFPVMVQSFKLLIDAIIQKELSSLPEEDFSDINLDNYSLSHMVYPNNYHENNLSFYIHFKFRGRYHITMTVTTVDDYAGECNDKKYGMYFSVLGQHLKPFTSLKEVVSFIKNEIWEVPKDLSWDNVR